MVGTAFSFGLLSRALYSVFIATRPPDRGLIPPCQGFFLRVNCLPTAIRRLRPEAETDSLPQRAKA